MCTRYGHKLHNWAVVSAPDLSAPAQWHCKHCVICTACDNNPVVISKHRAYGIDRQLPCHSQAKGMTVSLQTCTCMPTAVNAPARHIDKLSAAQHLTWRPYALTRALFRLVQYAMWWGAAVCVASTTIVWTHTTTAVIKAHVFVCTSELGIGHEPPAKDHEMTPGHGPVCTTWCTVTLKTQPTRQTTCCFQAGVGKTTPLHPQHTQT